MWFFFALFSACFQSSLDIVNKNSLKIKGNDENIICFGLFSFSMLALFPLALFNIPDQLEKNFYLILPISVTLDSLATIFYLKAMKTGALGEVMPLQMTTPLFAMIFAPFISGESVTLFGFLGILLIIFGAYSLNIKTSRQNFLAPIYAITHSKASRYMLLAAFFWGLLICFSKLGVHTSNQFFWAFSTKIPLTILFSIILLKKNINPITLIQQKFKYFLCIGTLGAMATCFLFTAYTLGNSVYAISVKRISVLIGICVGHFLYHETNFKEHFIGASIMIVGIFILAF